MSAIEHPPVAEFLIDTNCINARQVLPVMNALDRLEKYGVVQLLTPERAAAEMPECSAYNESANGRANKARQRIMLGVGLSVRNLQFDRQNGIDSDFDRRREIEDVVFPLGATKQSEVNDVAILELARHTRLILISMDGKSKTQPGGILGSAEALRQLGIVVMSPKQALDHVVALLSEGDVRQIEG